MPLLMVRQNIAKVTADAIVNPTNTYLKQESGISNTIYHAAGEEKLTEACSKIGNCDLGKAVITEGFGLPAKFIIHVASPTWIDGSSGEYQTLYSAYIEALKLAISYGLESIAFPLLSVESYGFPKRESLKIAMSAINNFLFENDMIVYLIIYDRKSLEISHKLFTSIEEYIDNHYVEIKNDSFPDLTRRRMDDAIPKSTNSFEMKNLEELLCHSEETFTQMLLRLIDDRAMTDAMVYKKANVDRKLFSKIRSNIYYKPSKKTIFCFAIALELSIEETEELLKKAGFAFSNCFKFDVVISYFIENKKYDIFELNEVLFQYDLPILGGM